MCNRRRPSVVPEIRVVAPSLERGLDESSQKSDQTLTDFVESECDSDRYLTFNDMKICLYIPQ